MPLIKPKKGENQSDFVARFMSSEAAKKEFPDNKQRLAIAHSTFGRKKKESMFCRVHGIETKEDNDLIKGGYIATTHLDSGFYDEEKDFWIRDKITKETLEHWRDEINAGVPRANKVSVNHNREVHVTGVGVRDSARVDLLPDGEYGLYSDSLIDKTKSDFDNTSYRLDKGLLDSFSIEFSTRDSFSGEYLEGAVEEQETDNGIIRTLLPGTQLEGWTLASQPMNENAIMIKEIIKIRKEVKMTDKEKKEEDAEAPKEESKAPKGETPKETPKEEPAKEKSSEEKELIKLGKEMKALKEKETKEKEIKEIETNILEKVKKAIPTMEVENKVAINKEGKKECKELKEFEEGFKVDSDLSRDSMAKIAGKISDMVGFTDKGGITGKTRDVMSRLGSYKFNVRKSKVKEECGKHLMEYKGLGLTTNQNTDTDYLLSAAELADVFDPVIFNILNQQTVTWNLLPKEDFSNKGNNQVQFTLKIAANTTAGPYLGNAVNTGNVTRQKYQTKFKKYQVGVEVDGDMIAAARGGPVGDVFAQEVQDSTDDLMSVINLALFAEVGAETAAGVIGFEYITDQAGNTTLYNLDRSQANGLASADTTKNYINGNAADISITNLRAAKRKAVGTEGANLNNMVWFTSFVQGDKWRGKFDSVQRSAPTSSRFGFEGRPEFDGIPIFEDKDCNDDDWFLVDLETQKIAMWVPPTLERLGKDSDSEKGFIKTYFATFNRAPRRMIQIYNNAT